MRNITIGLAYHIVGLVSKGFSIDSFIACDLLSVCASLILAIAVRKWMPKVVTRWFVRRLRAKPQDIMRKMMSFGEP